MNEAGYTIAVALYIHGADLEPSTVSDVLGVAPDKSHRRGERQAGKEGRTYLRKSGMWAVVSKLEPDSPHLSDHLDQVLSRLNFDASAIARIPNVEDAYFDFFLARMSEKAASMDCEFEVQAKHIAAIARLGVPTRFTIAVVDP